ncbi:MAG: GNAT family N-acetyltransferase [Anaerolineae bacterium]|nr:GNAT family N-acetyltransferase [Anaerolineae bacterium]
MTTADDSAQTTLFAGKLVRFAPVDAEALAAFARWTADAEGSRLANMGVVRPVHPGYWPPPDQADAWRVFSFALRTLADDALIGALDLEVDWPNQVCWLGISIGEPAYRGKGYGTDAMELALNYAFYELNLYRVSLSVFSYNPRAIHVYEKVGFKHEGRMRSVLFRDGQRHDMLFMGVLRPEWLALHPPPDRLGK